MFAVMECFGASVFCVNHPLIDSFLYEAALFILQFIKRCDGSKWISSLVWRIIKNNSKE